MQKSILVLSAAVILIGTSCASTKQQEQKKETVPVATKDDKDSVKSRMQKIREREANKYEMMDKKTLQDELKRLQIEMLKLEQERDQVQLDVSEARKAYRSASAEQKPDALLRMLESQGNEDNLIKRHNQTSIDFLKAQNAYKKLIGAEQE